ncbi:hypothetical protein [Nocardia sp. NRRL S-836]|uniref:hypothetical protein n=1 Tax=Nocardia sp. NRRL S-836 TaxID=1519492 RepID=UPI0006AF57FC|nr:hypothetical protein [Nocardia sp. NRRL S-836]KOV82912.1 hypothetical protein ADL03_23000 [Nocardia sp. NRRL S-836]
MFRFALGFFGVLAVAGGALLSVLHLWGGDTAPELAEAAWLVTLAGPIALGCFIAGLVPKPVRIRVVAGFLVMLIGFNLSDNLAKLVSLMADQGEQRDHLHHGVFGLVWLLGGPAFLWTALKSRWPVAPPAEQPG